MLVKEGVSIDFATEGSVTEFGRVQGGSRGRLEWERVCISVGEGSGRL